MPYCIMKVVYGVSLDEGAIIALCDGEPGHDFENFDDEKAEELGFELQYAQGFIVAFCGVVLCEFDECHFVKTSDLKFKPTAKQKKEAEEKIAKLPPEILAGCTEFCTHFVFSSS